VYRKAMGAITDKTTVSLKNHARVSQDSAIVELMTRTFDPILQNLLGNCENALLHCFHKLSARFEEFEQEFNYYRSALISLTKAAAAVKAEVSNAEANHAEDVADVAVKRELIAEATSDPSDVSMDPADAGESSELEDSDGLRQAYISFYVEEMEALWKERSSSLEMVQAIQRSLDQNAEASSADSGPSAPGKRREGWGKFEREEELREEIDKCLMQWKQVAWPTELTAAFVAPAAASSSVPAQSVKEEQALATVIDVDDDSEPFSTNSVMAELRKVMIDLTQDHPVAPAKTSQPSTLVVYHPAFIDHQTPKDHPECPERLTVSGKRLLLTEDPALTEANLVSFVSFSASSTSWPA